MTRLTTCTVLLLLLGAEFGESRPPAKSPVGAGNFGFFPSFAASRPAVPGPPKPPSRFTRSASPEISGKPESDMVDLNDFIARNGLELGKGDEGSEKDPDVSGANRREKRAEEESEGNNLSWLLEQDAWEKVDDAALDWDNVGKEEFDGSEGTALREARDVSSSDVKGDDINQRILQLAKELGDIVEEIEPEGEVSVASAKPSVANAVGNLQGDETPPQEDFKIDDDYLDDSMRRRRSVDNDVSVVEVEGRIDMSFKSKPESPSATVIIQKDPQSPNYPEIPPPIYFCGTKTDPNNPDSVSGEVAETIASH